MTALLEYLDLFNRFYACTVSVLYPKDICITTRKSYHFALIIPRTPPIIREYSQILSTTYYSRNCSDIIDASLLTRQCWSYHQKKYSVWLKQFLRDFEFIVQTEWHTFAALSSEVSAPYTILLRKLSSSTINIINGLHKPAICNTCHS